MVPRAETRSHAELRSQLDALRQLNAGWFDERAGLGEPISPALIAHVGEVLELTIERGHIAPPYVYPTVEGGIQAEWEIGVLRVDCEWTAVGEAYIHAFDVSLNASTAQELHDASTEASAALLIRAASPR